MRKRKRSVQLNNRWGSRRNRILFATSLSLIAIASWLFSSSSEVELDKYLVATSNLAASTPISSANLTATALDLGDTANQYLKATDKNLSKWVLTRPVNAGELISINSIAPLATADCTQIVVALGIAMANTIKVGDSIDLWAAEQSSSIESVPTQVVTGGELISVKMATDSFSQAAQSIEVCVSPAEIRSVVSAIARKSTVVVIRSPN